MLLVEPDSGDIVAVNDAAVSFYKYSHAELTSMAIQDLNALDAAEVARKRQQALSKESSHFVFPHRLKTGELCTVEVNSTPIEYEGDVLLFSIIQDISAQVESEQALTLAKTRFERLSEQNIVGVYTIEDRRFSYVNPVAADIFGTTPDQMIGTSVFDYIAAEDHDLAESHIANRERGTADAAHYTFTGVRSDGTRVRVEAHGGRVQTDDGVSIVGVLIDVTDRDTYERELHRLSQVLRYVAPAIYITDADGAIEYVNPAFERITGYTEAEAFGRNPNILSSGRMGEEYYQQMYATLTAAEVWEESIVNRRKDGEFYYAYQTIAPYLDDEGTIEGFVAIQSDTTDAKIREQILEVFQRIFRHNLRNKINIIRGNTDLLEPLVVQTPEEAYIVSIQNAAEALNSLSEKAAIVSETVDSSDGDKRIDLSRLLERQATQFSEAYPHATITCNGPKKLVVPGDGSVEVAIHELLENAIIHTDRSESVVEVTLREDESEEMAVLVIADVGPGLTDVERLPLELGKETPLQHTTGLGLWLVKWIVTSHGGELLLEDNEPRGLKVIISLPLADGI
ncbi:MULTISPECIES: PAS domain S-box protein [Haloferax]|nr:PAS domain S-box protein [Haloferax litoreum]